MSANASFAVAGDVLAGWRDDLLTSKPPTLYACGAGELARIELGPGRVLLLGGAPGAGKTGFACQLVFDALRLTPELRAVICNVEMSMAALLDRQLARLSGVALDVIRKRQLGAAHADRIDQAIATLEPLAERLAFCRPPYDLANVAATADDFAAGLLLLDYIQRIPPPGEHADRRHSVDASMKLLRAFAAAGVAVLVVSAVGRGKDARGRSSYGGDALSLASFRESSELEFGADDAYLLAPDSEPGAVTLRHLKSRYGECRDVPLTFDGVHQRFTPAATADSSAPKPDAGRLRSALAALWNRTPAAADDGGNE
jgi:replicative DNA helicase